MAGRICIGREIGNNLGYQVSDVGMLGLILR
jgi:hypothetical protein